jgi:hypothetical protein
MAINAARTRPGPLALPIASGATLLYRAWITDELGEVLAAADLEMLTLTIADAHTGEIINTVDHQDILDTDRGSFSGVDGKLEISLISDDTLLADGTLKATRALIIEWTWDTDHLGRHQYDFKIEALSAPP